MLARDEVTLGILAGGQGTRLGGRDKAWLLRDGVPQVLRIARGFDRDCGAVLVSANRGLPSYAEHGMSVVEDRIAGIGPIGGLEALASACTSPWLLTIPVDVVNPDEGLLRALASAGGDGSVAVDDDGPQPLVALYRRDALRSASTSAIEANDFSVHAMQARMQLPRQHFNGMRIGNLNTPDDLQRAGVGHV